MMIDENNMFQNQNFFSPDIRLHFFGGFVQNKFALQYKLTAITQ